MQLPEPQTVDSYAFTSGDDVPDRDPRSWVLEGSADGKTWAEVDRRALDKPFEKRHQTKTFEIAHPGAFRFYRFTFAPTPIRTFQVAEIALAGAGKPPPPCVGDGYRRDLNLMQGVAHTQYRRNGVTFTRDLVVSKPDEVIALRSEGRQAGRALVHRRAGAQAERGHPRRRRRVRPRRPTAVQQARRGRRGHALPGPAGREASRAARSPPRIEGLVVEGADEVTLIVSAGTDWKDKEFAKLARQRLDAALAKSFDALREAAVADHRRFMERCQLTLPEGPNSKLPTPERVKRQEKTPDPALAALYFQFGRHLVVSGSRPDSQLPTNLQGIWAEEYDTPWRGDFHSNINLQMNYWPVEAANLSDCHLPLLRFIQSVAKEGEKTAKAYFNAPGWMANHTQNPWYDTAPSFLPACIGPTCGAWLAQHIWLHYAFTQDKAFLREYYPVLRGASQFMQAVLVEDPKTHELVVVPSNSPENSYAYTDQQRQAADDRAVRRRHLRPANHPRSAEEHRRRRAHPGDRRGVRQEPRRHARQARAHPRERRRPHHGMAGGFRGDGSPSPPLLASVGPVPGQRNQPQHARALPRAPACRWNGAAMPRPAGAWPGRPISGPACTTATAPTSSSPCSSAAARRTCSVSMRRSRSTATSAAARPWPKCCCRARKPRPTASPCSNCCPRCRKPGTPARCAACAPAAASPWTSQWKDGKVTSYRIASAEPREVKVRVNGETKTISPRRWEIPMSLPLSSTATAATCGDVTAAARLH